MSNIECRQDASDTSPKQLKLVNTPPNSQNSKRHKVQHNTQVPVEKHNNRQHASPHHEVATDVKQMPIRPIIIIIIDGGSEFF